MENRIFDWQRFANTVNRDIRSLWPTFGPTLLIIVLLPIVVWIGALVFGDIYTVTIPPIVRIVMIGCVITLAGIMAPSRIYRTANLHKEGIYFAMLPASKLEKYLSMLLMVLVVVPIVTLCGSVVLDMLLTLLPFGGYRSWLWSSGLFNSAEWMDLMGQDYELYETFIAYITPFNQLVSTVLSYVATVSLFIFTSTLFKKHKVLYTILWLWLIQFVLTVVAVPVMITIFKDSSANLLEYIENNFSPNQFFAQLYTLSTIAEVLFSALMLWWSGYRLKRMRY